MSMPRPKEPPPPPNKLDTMNDALRAQAQRRAGGTVRSSTDVTQGLAGTPNVSQPMAGSGKTILGG